MTHAPLRSDSPTAPSDPVGENPMSPRVRVFDFLDGVDARQWDELWLRAPDANIYQSPEWYRAWMKCMGAGARPRIVAVFVDDELAGICPLAVWPQVRHGVCRRTVLTFISSFSAAYPLDQGPLVDPRWTEPVLEAMAEAIGNMRGFAAVAFELYESGSLAARLLSKIAARAGRPCEERVCARSHLVDLPDSYEAFIEALGSRTRRNVRNYSRRFFEGGPDRKIEAAASPEAIAELLDAMREQKERRFTASGRHSTLEDERFDAFLKEVGAALVGRGRLAGWTARIGERIAATQLVCFDEHGHFYSYNSSFDLEFQDLRLHYLLEAERFAEAIRRGYRRADLSTGHDEHKRHWSNGQTRDLYEGVIVVSPWRNILFRVAEWAKQRLRSKPQADATPEAEAE